MATSNSTRITPEVMSVTTCFLIDFPETENRTYCSVKNASHCVTCPILGQFVTGESLEKYDGLGHLISIFTSIVASSISVFGVAANCLIIAILLKMKSNKAFHSLLMALAVCDLFCCITVVMVTVAMLSFFENIDRGKAMTYVAYIGGLSVLYARSLSTYMTVLIAIERYLILAFPFKANSWFTKVTTRILIGCVVLFSSLMAFPRYSSIYVGKNEVGKDIIGMSQFEYLLHPTPLASFWYVTAAGFFNAVDYWLPFPLLLTFNVLVFLKINKWEKRRMELTKNAKKDISSTKMLTIVVIVLFLCNILPIIHFFFIVRKVIYRELYCAVLLSLSVNSSANLVIYYCKEASFSAELRLFLTKAGKSFSKVSDSSDIEGTSSSAKVIGVRAGDSNESSF